MDAQAQQAQVKAMYDALASIDSHTLRDVDYLKPVVESLWKNDVRSVQDLVNMQYSDFEKSTLPASSGKRAYLSRVIDHFNSRVISKAPAAVDSSGTVACLIKALKKEDPTIHVDVGSKLRAVSLGDFPHHLWPGSEAVDDMACRVKKQSKKGIAKPFVYMEVSKFLPPWATVGRATADEESEGEGSFAAAQLAKAMSLPTKRKEKPLKFTEWCAAFDRYAIAACITGQLTFAAACSHKDVVLQVSARTHGKCNVAPTRVAVLYDERARKAWAEKAAAGVADFDISVAAAKVDEELLARVFREVESPADVPTPTPRPDNQYWGGNRQKRSFASAHYSGQHHGDQHRPWKKQRW